MLICDRCNSKNDVKHIAVPTLVASQVDQSAFGPAVRDAKQGDLCAGCRLLLDGHLKDAFTPLPNIKDKP